MPGCGGVSSGVHGCARGQGSIAAWLRPSHLAASLSPAWLRCPSLPPPAVVDSHTFIQDYSSRSSLAARPDLGDGGSLRPVVDLLVEQIE